MITRLRHPDGTDTSIDHGPGPVGRSQPRALGGVPVAQGIGIAKLGLQPGNPLKAAYQREWRKRQR